MPLLEIVKFTKISGEPFEDLQEFYDITSETDQFFEQNFPDHRYLDTKVDITTDKTAVVAARVWADEESKTSWKRDLRETVGDEKTNLFTKLLYEDTDYNRESVKDLDLSTFTMNAEV
jgi:hypothetical protein